MISVRPLPLRLFRGADSAAWRSCARTAGTVGGSTRVPVVGAVRNLHLHEFPSMELMRNHGIRTPGGYIASTPDEAEELFRTHFQKSSPSGDGSLFRDAVLKAQVLSGGRHSGTFRNGFEGGVHVVSDPDQARDFAANMLGQKLVTKQAPEGVVCNQVLLVERLKLQREFYLSILMDRSSQGPLLIGSPVGGSSGTSIVEIARSHPNLIFTEEIDIMDGLELDQCERMAENIGLDPGSDPATFDQAVDTMMKLYEVFEKRDCTQIEVNPLAEAVGFDQPGGKEAMDMVVVDAKVRFDDNAAFRQESIFAQRDYDQEDPREAEAIRHGIDYIGLDGSIGCMVNGAGLAMATMDLIHSKGGRPSNFLDVGGGADVDQIRAAFRILEADPRVSVILVNIFGGLMRCDVIASGILGAAETIGIRTPLVVRLQGTNYEEAKALIAESGAGHISMASDLDDAATQAVRTAERLAAGGGVEPEELDGGGMGLLPEADDFDDDPLSISSQIPGDGGGAARRAAIPRFEGFSI